MNHGIVYSMTNVNPGSPMLLVFFVYLSLRILSKLQVFEKFFNYEYLENAIQLIQHGTFFEVLSEEDKKIFL